MNISLYFKNRMTAPLMKNAYIYISNRTHWLSLILLLPGLLKVALHWNNNPSRPAQSANLDHLQQTPHLMIYLTNLDHLQWTHLSHQSRPSAVNTFISPILTICRDHIYLTNFSLLSHCFGDQILILPHCHLSEIRFKSYHTLSSLIIY